MITINLYIYNRKGGSLLRKIRITRLKTNKFFKKFLFLSSVLRKNIKNQHLQKIRLEKRKNFNMITLKGGILILNLEKNHFVHK